MPLTPRENWLRAIEFRHPEWIPCSVSISPLTWLTYRRDLEEIVLAHPALFPDYEEGDAPFYGEMPVVYRGGEYFRDNWECLWYNIQEGLEGQVVEHPLADWRALDTYRMPDPMLLDERNARDWTEIQCDIERRRRKGLWVTGNGERLFDRLYFLRGWENLMVDFAEGRPELERLIAMLEEHELPLIQRWLQIGVDAVAFHTDIGTQRALMISPAAFRRYVKPLFARLFGVCRAAGAHVFLSSDGHLLDIVDDLIECGVSVHDPQLRACTLEGIARAYRGRMCACVDLDRQGFAFMTAEQCRAQVHEVVGRMALPEGGLMLQAAVYDADVPLRNIEALCEAMEEYAQPRG
jgi:uroporphyrinogen decarboxylase